MSGRKSSNRGRLKLRFQALGGLGIGSNIYLLELKEGDEVLFRVFLDAGLKITEDNMLDVGTMGLIKDILLDEKYRIPPFGNSVQAIIISHVHEDHVGMLPWIYRMCHKYGIREPITYMSPISCELFITTQEELYETVYGYAARRTKERYGDDYFWDKNDIRACKIHPVEYWSRTRIHEDDIAGGYEICVKFFPSGHILGSAFTELRVLHEGKMLGRILYTGDFCIRQASFIVKNGYRSLKRIRESIDKEGPYDLLITEGTYYLNPRIKGDITEIKKELAKKIAEAFDRGGNLVLAVYGLDRSQNVLVCLREIVEALEGKDVPEAFVRLKEHYPFKIFFDTRIGQITTDKYLAYFEERVKLARCFKPYERFRYEHEIRDELIERYERSGLDPFEKSSGGYVSEPVAPERRKDIVGEYSDGGRCIVVATSATGAPSPIHEYLGFWGEEPKHTFITMGTPIPGSPMWKAIREYKRKGRARFTVFLWDEEERRSKPCEIEIRARLTSFDLISAHATHDEIVRLLSEIDARYYGIVHIGIDIEKGEELMDYIREGAIKASLARFIRRKRAGRLEFIPRSVKIEELLDGFEVWLRKPKRLIHLPDDIWSWLRSLSAKWYKNKPFNEKVAIQVLRRLRQEWGKLSKDVG